MEPILAQGFVYRMLNAEERAKLLKVEASLPPRRFLQGFEVCRLFGLKLKPRTDDEIAAMEKTAAEFSKILWKQRVLTYREENPELSDAEILEVVDGKIDQDDLPAWREYAARHYQPPSGQAVAVESYLG